MIFRFLVIFLIFFVGSASANNINVKTFDELISSASQTNNGDSITILDNLYSDSTIGGTFSLKDLTFLGQNFNIDGGNTFGGFLLNEGGSFDKIRIINCVGQDYNIYVIAGAIYNSSNQTNIASSAFSNNHADAQGSNFAVAGALYNENGGNVSLNAILFDNNYTNGASAQGGAIGNNGANSVINITDSVFNNNYADGSVLSYGGAIYNNNGAIMNIKNSLFYNNHSLAKSNGVYLYGGSIYNTGDMAIDNSYFSNNYIEGNLDSFAYGGAIHNNSNLTITNTTFDNNYITSDIDTSGGAIYNYADGNVVIENSLFKNNYLNAQNSRGCAIANQGIMSIINSTFVGNKDTDGLNDIYNFGILNFDGDGTTNILDGIRGTGNINKNDNGILNLGGNNSRYTGAFSFYDGTINLLANSTYFNAKTTDFENGVNFNMQNGQIDNVDFEITTLHGQSNIYPDVDFNNNTMDTISASYLTGGGTILVPNLATIGVPEAEFISIPFADSILKNSVRYNSKIIKTPIYDYLSSYDIQNGNFDFSRTGFNSGILAPMVSAQLAGYLLQIDTFNNIFSNLDMVMILNKDKKTALDFKDKIAYNGQNQYIYSPLSIPEANNGIWYKPYATFSSVPLKNGPDVSNVGYGGIFGAESGLINLKRGWRGLYGGYGSYNGSHQSYDGIGIYNNGGLLGLSGALYKNNFFSLWSANVGANSAKAHTSFGNDDFNMLYTGIAQKSGFNLGLFNDRFIVQPNLMLSYSFVNTFDFTNSSNVQIDAKPLNILHIEPQIKLIGNFGDLLQPYLAVSVAWNIMNDARFYANDVMLPELSIKPYVKYGAGIQKRWGDNLTAFFQTYITNGGRNGVGLQLGLRWSIGKETNRNADFKAGNIPEKPKTVIELNNKVASDL